MGCLGHQPRSLIWLLLDPKVEVTVVQLWNG